MCYLEKRKIVYKQTIWMVYRRTRKDEHYTNYKYALNTATTEIRQHRKSYEQTLTCNITNESKICLGGWTTRRECWKYNIKRVFSMAEDLIGYFSSMFTREDISSVPVPDAKFQEAKTEYLGQLNVTPEIVAQKIKAMKD